VGVQVIHYLRESNKEIQTEIILHGEVDRQVITSVFKEDKPLRLELQKKRLHQAIDITFDKYCVCIGLCLRSTSCYKMGFASNLWLKAFPTSDCYVIIIIIIIIIIITEIFRVA